MQSDLLHLSLSGPWRVKMQQVLPPKLCPCVVPAGTYGKVLVLTPLSVLFYNELALCMVKVAF